MALLALNLAAIIAALLAIQGVHKHLIEHIDRQTHHLERLITMTTQDTINAVVVQLGKAKDEIVAEIASLQAQIDAGVPAEQLDLTTLTSAAQALDDIVPDAPEVPSEPAPGEVTGEPIDAPTEPTA